MLYAILLAATYEKFAYQPPRPVIKFSHLIGVRDLPPDFPAEAEAKIGFELRVSAQGTVIGCVPDYAHSRVSGVDVDTMGQHTCALARKRMKFDPARAEDGSKVAWFYYGWADWSRNVTPDGEMYTVPPPTPVVAASPRRQVVPLPVVANRDPVPKGNISSWITPADYPRAQRLAGVEGTTQVRLSIGPDGRVVACRIDDSSGSRVLDELTCKLITQRGRFNALPDGSASELRKWSMGMWWHK